MKFLLLAIGLKGSPAKYCCRYYEPGARLMDPKKNNYEFNTRAYTRHQ
jgi:hypothetical protein